MRYITTLKLNLLGLEWFDSSGLADLPIKEIYSQIQSNSTKPSSPSTALPQPLAERFASVFQDGLGHCTQMKATLRVKPGAQPVFRPKRPVPYAAVPLVDAELQRLEKLGVLSPVTYSAWAAPIVVVKKSNGAVRICADFSTGLNVALEDHHYPLPVPEDLFTMLNGATCFAKIDLADAYFQIEVEEEVRQLLTINTHRGLYQYNRLPFGVKTAPAIFQQIVDTMITGISGCAAYLDDIIIAGRSRKELEQRIAAVLERIQTYGFRLRSEKCQFFLQSIRYLGFIFDEHGRRPDPENIAAIQRMPAPKDIGTLRSFLGLISHYSSFLPALHTARSPLNHLLQKDAKWNWSTECERTFCKLKEMLSSDLLLTHFNPNLTTVVAADASNYGVGAVISHIFPDGSEKATAHASRTLTPAEKNYAQIEKEALALIFAVKKFHKMLYGRHFILLTDHKPLVAIFGSKKGIPVYSASRLQRWATILLGYDFEIRFRRTEEHGQADALSRLIGAHHQPEEDMVIASISLEEDMCRTFTDAIRAIPVTADDVQRATIMDPILQQAIKFIRNGWPNTKFDGELRQLYLRRESLTVINNCLLFADRVVIPFSLRSTVLKQFHTGHPGTGRMKALARSYVYWPNIDADIEDLVKRCSKCMAVSKNPPRLAPEPWPTPDQPWSRVHVDFAGPIAGKSYLVLVDAYSKWLEINPMA